MACDGLSELCVLRVMGRVPAPRCERSCSRAIRSVPRRLSEYRALLDDVQCCCESAGGSNVFPTVVALGLESPCRKELCNAALEEVWRGMARQNGSGQ